jgi:putative endonuclease
MYYVYVLYSLKDHRLYNGFTSDIQKRLAKHNSGGSTSTSRRKPFVLVHIEAFSEKSDALKRELHLKSSEGGSNLSVHHKALKILCQDNILNLHSRP